MEEVTLPPLPKTDGWMVADKDDFVGERGYTDTDMREYARAAVRMERERESEALREAAVLLRSLSDATLSVNNLRSLAAEWLDEFAAAIRGEGGR